MQRMKGLALGRTIYRPTWKSKRLPLRRDRNRPGYFDEQKMFNIRPALRIRNIDEQQSTAFKEAGHVEARSRSCRRPVLSTLKNLETVTCTKTDYVKKVDWHYL